MKKEIDFELAEGVAPDFAEYNANVLLLKMRSWDVEFRRVMAVFEKRRQDDQKVIADLMKRVNDLQFANTALRDAVHDATPDGGYVTRSNMEEILKALEDDDRDARANRDEIGFVRAWLGEKK